MTECTANHRTFWWSWWWGIVWRGWRKWRSPRTRLCSTRATKIWVVSKTVTKRLELSTSEDTGFCFQLAGELHQKMQLSIQIHPEITL